MAITGAAAPRERDAMLLRSLSVRDFQGLTSISLGEFAEGLSVVVGDNEAGKSTLLAALRAAFFQRHRGTSEMVKAFAPYRGSGRPEVAVEFDIAGAAYRLEKAFLQRQSASLLAPGGELKGDAVEEHLAELLGFTPPGRGESKPTEHQGAFGLLWVEQGRSNVGLDVGAGRDALTASLEGEVGRMLGGERGRSLIESAKVRRDVFLTDTGRERGNSPLKEAEERLAAVLREEEEKRLAYASFEAKLSRLTQLRRTLADYESEATVAKAEQALVAAEEAVRRAGERDREVREAQAALTHAKAARDAALERLQRRDDLMTASAKAATSVETAREAFAEADAQARHAQERLTAALRERDAARLAEQHAEERAAIRRRSDEFLRRRGELVQLEARIGEADRVATDLADRRRARAEITIDADSLRSLEEAERRRRECEIKLSVAAPSILFEPASGGRVTGADGALIESGAAQRVMGPTRYVLEGFGAVTIEPGGDAAALGDELGDAERMLARALSERGVATVAEARRAIERRRALESEITILTARLGALLPEGLDEARRRRDGLRAAITAVDSGEGVDRTGSGGDEGEEASDPERVLEAARDLSRRIESQADSLRRLAQDSAIRRAAAESDWQHRAAEAKRLAAEARQEEERVSREALAGEVAAGERELAAKTAAFDVRERENAASDRQALEVDRNARKRGLDAIVRTVRDLRDSILSLEAECRSEGASGLGERVAEIAGEIEEARRMRDRLRRQAEASRLLYDTLVAAERESRERWLGPIKARVTPYLRLLDPEAEIALDEETLEIRGLRRRGQDEDFQRLSHGAREQVAVVARLGLAEVLRTSGHPAAVILDDALVNTDEARLERMHQVLRAAARHLQIIVLTCRERDFRDLGAPIFRL